jgi:hypothetical protein
LVEYRREEEREEEERKPTPRGRTINAINGIKRGDAR